MSSTPDLAQFKRNVLGRSVSEQSWSEYERWILRFEAWCDRENITDPNIGDLEAFDGFLADESRTAYPWDNGQGRPAPAAYSYHSRITAISAVKKWVRREYGRRIDETPSDIAIGQPEPFDPTYLTPQQVDGVFDDADHACGLDGCETALRLSYDAILRASELVRVRREDVDLDAGTVYVRATKGSSNMEVGVADTTVRALADHIAANPERKRLFHNSYGRAWQASSWATHVMRNHCEAGSHALGRHSPIFHRLEGGQSFAEVYRRARHDSPSMTTKYARIVGVDVPEWSDD